MPSLPVNKESNKYLPKSNKKFNSGENLHIYFKRIIENDKCDQRHAVKNLIKMRNQTFLPITYKNSNTKLYECNQEIAQCNPRKNKVCLISYF